VIDWIKKRFETTAFDPKILDLGCGNGHFTLKLIEAGWKNVAALDYSEKAVELARKLVGFNSFEDDRIFKADILNPSTLPSKHCNTFDLIVDKGTFDAISLNPDFEGLEKVSKTKIIADAFKNTLKTLLSNEDSLFIITSCNWTSHELEQIFGPEFKPIGEVTHTKFMFGGKSGQDVSTIIFQNSN
jgi:EEF1A lysine methyltransferase 2